MFVSITYPIADFRKLHPEGAGRLDRPRWGENDPQAAFARGFGSIHTRTRSGSGFVGENYYADCENLIRYPSQLFVNPLVGRTRETLFYPIYRRFFFDGEVSGRFELGFRMNEASIWEIDMRADIEGIVVQYDAISVASGFLGSMADVNLLDGRRLNGTFDSLQLALRDAYLVSSTKNQLLKQYDIEHVGSSYVSVGAPFIFIRAGSDTPIADVPRKREISADHDLDMFGAWSGRSRRNFDTVVIRSKESLEAESARERFARLFYTQLRTLCFAHSFYLRQLDDGKIVGPSKLDGAIEAIIQRIANLSPLAGDKRDEATCLEMARIAANFDFDPERMADEIRTRIKSNRLRRWLGGLFSYFDRKADKAIEAAASTMTKHVLTGGS